MKRKLICFLLSMMLVGTLVAPALAAENTQDIPPLPDCVLYYGRIKELLNSEDGTLSGIRLTSERYGEYVMNISEETVWIDSGNRVPGDSADLKIDQGIYVFHSPISTRSLPPQSAALAVVWNVPQDAGCAQYHVVEKISASEDGSVSIVTDGGALTILASQAAEVFPYLTKNLITVNDISEGSRIMAWYRLPASASVSTVSATHIMVLPPLTADMPDEGAFITIQANDTTLDVTGRYENGVVMVPVAAVARALGLEANYTPKDSKGQVAVESDTFAVYLRFGESMIYGATKIEGAVGMTAPQDYGTAVYAVAPGTTWAPAELFKLLGKTVTLQDGKLMIG